MNKKILHGEFGEIESLSAVPLIKAGARSVLDHMKHVLFPVLKSASTISVEESPSSGDIQSAPWHSSEAKRAGTTRYSERNIWQAAATSVKIVDFGGIAPPGGSRHFDRPASLTLSGVKFVGRGLHPGAHDLVVTSASGNAYVSCWGEDDKMHGGGVEIHVSLPPGTTAIGLDVMITFQAFIPSDAFFTVTLSTGHIFDKISSTPPPRRTFVGFVSDQPIASMKLISTRTFPMLANFSFGARR